MDALVIFSSENNHPLSWLLSKERRHVWCAIRDTERGHWLSYDWAQGIPKLVCEAPSDFNLKAFYEEQGFEVIETTVGDVAPHGPLQWNNCVGHVKTMLAINSYALVPNGLYKYLTRTRTVLRMLSFVPGFGSKRAATPAPPPVVQAPESDMSKRARSASNPTAEATARKKVQVASASSDDSSSTLLTKKA